MTLIVVPDVSKDRVFLPFKGSQLFTLEGEGTESWQVSDAITQRRNFTSQKTSNIILGSDKI
jgi:hypothetical protein